MDRVRWLLGAFTNLVRRTRSNISVAAAALATLATLAACDAAPPPPAALAPGAHRLLADDGVPLVYHVAGHGPVVLVHPGGPGLGWDYLRMPWLERALTVVYLEPAGTGASGALAQVPRSLVRRHADDVDAVRRALGVERIVLLGHSYGGGVAMRYAIEHGEHLAGLVLYSTSAVTDAAWSADTDAAVEGFAREPWFAAVHALLGAPPPPAEHEHDCTRLRRLMPFYFADYTHRHAELAAFVRTLRCWPRPEELAKDPKEQRDDLRPELARVAAPTLVITGRHDWLFPPKWAQVTAAALADARVIVLEESGHFAHLEQPQAFAAAVATFVRGAAGGARSGL
jgi:proline iminopeptidase